MECDVLVIGAGPAGSSAAAAAAKGGAKVVLLERKREVGVPVQCAGVVSAFLMPLVPFNIPDEYLLWRNDAVVFSAGDVAVTRRGGVWKSYAIDRSGLDSWLAENAVRSGAKLRLETELIELEVGKDFAIEKATAKTPGGGEVFEPEVLIAADGADSFVSRKLWVKREDCAMGRGLLYEFSDMELKSGDADQIFFGDFAPGGYAHIFPTSKDSANIGVGSIRRDIDLEGCFQRFCSVPEVERQIRHAEARAVRSGNVTFGRPLDKMHYGNTLFAGEAAGQNMKPLVEGLLPAIICGDIAGETAAEHIRNGVILNAYEEKLKERVGMLFGFTDKFIDVLEELSLSQDEKSYLTMMGLCSSVFSVEDFNMLKKEGYDGIKQRIEDWNASRIKQLKSGLEERIWASYLKIFGGRKLFKL